MAMVHISIWRQSCSKAMTSRIPKYATRVELHGIGSARASVRIRYMSQMSSRPRKLLESVLTYVNPNARAENRDFLSNTLSLEGDGASSRNELGHILH